MLSMRILLYEYKKSLKLTRAAYREAELKTDRSIIGGMISDLEFVIEWIQKGRNPDSFRGADKIEVYLTDPFDMDKQDYGNIHEVPSGDVSGADKDKISDALSVLSKREKEIFILAKVELLSYEEIADLLGIKKSTVQTHMERAGEKIERRKNESLFLVV